jgi:hypothetical protein
MLTSIAEVESSIDASQQLSARHVIIEVERVEKPLDELDFLHDDVVLPTVHQCGNYKGSSGRDRRTQRAVDWLQTDI